MHISTHTIISTSPVFIFFLTSLCLQLPLLSPLACPTLSPLTVATAGPPFLNHHFLLSSLFPMIDTLYCHLNTDGIPINDLIAYTSYHRYVCCNFNKLVHALQVGPCSIMSMTMKFWPTVCHVGTFVTRVEVIYTCIKFKNLTIVQIHNT